jgi:YHS domain-containing protein
MKDKTEKMFFDPVCGLEVSIGDPRTLVGIYKGQSYYFCAECCLKVFEKKPEKYLKPKGHAARFLERLTKANEKAFGRSGPPCH